VAHDLVPLPFDPSRLAGLSERLLRSHHENNYGGAVRNLNKVEERLAQVTRDTPGFEVAALCERELLYTNSMILHELSFANLGGDGKPSGDRERALAATHGSLARWEELFRATAMSLGGGSGWVVLAWNGHTKDLRTYGSGNHTQAVAHGRPLLALDLYEHAYHLDHGAQHARYIDAFFQNLNWDDVNRRFADASS
jgi:superoxide dismutase, Fe-Mn family